MEKIENSDLENNQAFIDVQQKIDGLNAQYYLRIQSGKYVSGFGLGVEGGRSDFIVHSDSFALGNPAGGDEGVSYPFIFRNTPYTDLNTGTVFPVGAYMKSAFMDYASIKLAHIDTASIGSLSAISADLGTIKVGSANIAQLAVDTLHIKDRAVTVPLGVQQQITTANFTGNVASGWTKDVTVAFPGIETISAGSFCTLFFRSNFTFVSTSPNNLVIEVYIGSSLLGSISSVNIPGDLNWEHVRMDDGYGNSWTSYLPTSVAYAAQVMEQGSVQIAFTMPSGVTASTALRFIFKNNGGAREVTTSGSYVNLFLVEFKK